METITALSSDYSAYLILIAVLGILVTILTNVLTPAQSFLAATLLLIITGVSSVDEFLHSFSNTQVITIFLLIFLTVVIQQNLDVNKLFNFLFPQSLSQRSFVLRLSVVVSFFSAFVNNTPLVSLFMANVQQWAGKKKISPSKFLIPLSYAALLGGMMTMIGTSTNMVLMGLLSSNNEPLLRHTDFLVVGLAVTITGIIYIFLFTPKLLKDRKIPITQFAENRGEYIHEVELVHENDLEGKTVAHAGLKNLQGIYLVEIVRHGEVITPVPPDILIESGDHFYFAGDTELVVEFIQNKRGLMLSSEGKIQKEGQGNIVEVVIAANSKLAGVLVKDSNFREDYNASIIGIHRNGEKISGKIGYLKLRSGDLLLLLTGNDFQKRITNDKNLFLLTEIKRSFEKPVVRGKWFYYILQLLIITFWLFKGLSFFLALFISLFILIMFRYITIDAIKRNFSLDLLIVLACSLTLGKAFINSGAADLVSEQFLQIIHSNDIRYVLTGLFIFTAIITSFITNVAAVSIAFPMAFSLANHMGVDGGPFYLSIAFAASAAFITPMAYQTNMMVYGPGGYKSIDFLKAGVPLLLIYTITSLLMIFWWYGL